MSRITKSTVYSHSFVNGKCELCGCNEYSEGLQYTLNNNNEYTVAGIGACTDKDIIIPSTYRGLPVTSIYTEAFRNNTDITSIVIPNSVIRIGRYAFDNCENLSHIELPDSVTYIDSYAFRYCISLESVVIPDGIKEISISLFEGCSNLTNLVIGSGVTNIGTNAFNYCTSLKTVVLPHGLETIGMWAFGNCTSLENVTIPSSVAFVGFASFSSTNINNLYITDLEAWCRIKHGETGSGIKNEKLYLNGKLITELIIPDSITVINDYAFEGCASITSVVIPDHVTSIGREAFYDCNNLTSVTIGNGVVSIGREAFDSCDNLSTVIIGNGVTTINENAFFWLHNLKSVYYLGTPGEWVDIIIYVGNDELLTATRYYYSNSKPENKGNYWHYVDGVATPW